MGIFNSQAKLLYDDPKQPVIFVTLVGAWTDIDEDGKIVEYSPWDKIMINVAQICAVYDHTVIISGHKIRVMETLEEIRQKLAGIGK